MILMDEDWRKTNIDPEIQQWMHKPIPAGLAVLYAGVNTVDRSRAYIGKCASHKRSAWSSRIYMHHRGEKHKKTHIHNAIKKYGKEAFTWFILKVVAEDEVNQEETDAIARHGTLKSGYNEQPGGEGGMTPEALAKMTAKKRTPESRKKASKNMKDFLTNENPLEKHLRHVKIQNGRLSTTEKKESFAKKMHATNKKTREERIAKARRELLPFTPKYADRIPGRYYARKDGMIGYCTTQRGLVAVAPIVPDLSESGG